MIPSGNPRLNRPYFSSVSQAEFSDVLNGREFSILAVSQPNAGASEHDKIRNNRKCSDDSNHLSSFKTDGFGSISRHPSAVPLISEDDFVALSLQALQGISSFIYNTDTIKEKQHRQCSVALLGRSATSLSKYQQAYSESFYTRLLLRIAQEAFSTLSCDRGQLAFGAALGDLLLLLDASVSTLHEKLKIDERISVGQLWSSVSLHRSVLSQLFQIIAPEELFTSVRSVFSSSLCDNSKVMLDSSQRHERFEEFEQFQGLFSHFMQCNSWVVDSNSSSFSSNCNNSIVNINISSLSGSSNNNGYSSSNNNHVGWSILDTLLASVEVSRKMITSTSNGITCQNMPLSLPMVSRNRSANHQNNHHSPTNIENNANNMSDDEGTISDSLGKVIIILFLVKRVSEPLLLGLQMRLFSLISDFDILPPENHETQETKKIQNNIENVNHIAIGKAEENVPSGCDVKYVETGVARSGKSKNNKKLKQQERHSKQIEKEMKREEKKTQRIEERGKIRAMKISSSNCDDSDDSDSSHDWENDSDYSEDTDCSTGWSTDTSSGHSTDTDSHQSASVDSDISMKKIENATIDSNNIATTPHTLSIAIPYTSTSVPYGAVVTSLLRSLERAKDPIRLIYHSNTPAATNQATAASMNESTGTKKSRGIYDDVGVYSPNGRTCSSSSAGLDFDESKGIENDGNNSENKKSVEENRERFRQQKVSSVMRACRDTEVALLIPSNYSDLQGLESLVAAATERYQGVRRAVLEDINNWIFPPPVEGVRGLAPKVFYSLKDERDRAKRRALLEETLLDSLPSDPELVKTTELNASRDLGSTLESNAAIGDLQLIAGDIYQAIIENRESTGEKMSIEIGGAASDTVPSVTSADGEEDDGQSKIMSIVPFQGDHDEMNLESPGMEVGIADDNALTALPSVPPSSDHPFTPHTAAHTAPCTPTTPTAPSPPIPPVPRSDLSSIARQIIYPDMRTLDREMEFRETVTSSLSRGLMALARANGIVFTPAARNRSTSAVNYRSTAANAAGAALTSKKSNEQNIIKDTMENVVKDESDDETLALVLLMQPLKAMLDRTLLSAVTWQCRVLDQAALYARINATSLSSGDYCGDNNVFEMSDENNMSDKNEGIERSKRVSKERKSSECGLLYHIDCYEEAFLLSSKSDVISTLVSILVETHNLQHPFRHSHTVFSKQQARYLESVERQQMSIGNEDDFISGDFPFTPKGRAADRSVTFAESMKNNGEKGKSAGEYSTEGLDCADEIGTRVGGKGTRPDSTLGPRTDSRIKELWTSDSLTSALTKLRDLRPQAAHFLTHVRYSIAPARTPSSSLPSSSSSSPSYSIFSISNLSRLHLSYSAPWPISSLITEALLRLTAKSTKRLLELAQLTALVRLVWLDMRGRKINPPSRGVSSGTGAKSKKIEVKGGPAPSSSASSSSSSSCAVFDRECSHALRVVQQTLLPLGDFSSDRIKYQRIRFREFLVDASERGVSGVGSALLRYAEGVNRSIFAEDDDDGGEEDVGDEVDDGEGEGEKIEVEGLGGDSQVHVEKEAGGNNLEKGGNDDNDENDVSLSELISIMLEKCRSVLRILEISAIQMNELETVNIEKQIVKNNVNIVGDVFQEENPFHAKRVVDSVTEKRKEMMVKIKECSFELLENRENLFAVARRVADEDDQQDALALLMFFNQ